MIAENHVTKELVLGGADWQSHSKRAIKLQKQIYEINETIFWRIDRIASAILAEDETLKYKCFVFHYFYIDSAYHFRVIWKTGST